MAEKEERYISITQMIAKENIETEKYRVMPRQEAIERMANALSLVQAKTFVDEIQWERVMNGCRYEAEAALNALLEGK